MTLDKERLVQDLSHQTQSYEHRVICNASGGPIRDRRIACVAWENPLNIFMLSGIFCGSWTGLDWPMNMRHASTLTSTFHHMWRGPRCLQSWRSISEEFEFYQVVGIIGDRVVRRTLSTWSTLDGCQIWDALKATWMECKSNMVGNRGQSLCDWCLH
ncbi:hypothetical protein K503DRAFT_344264 [Rhizopogon vinicolor AM-OR11-026]|uniref:Uncharacterized protein n=1 Tax=Rhizopogon vinicolor AM-OR11-026 TaxID=1314800 RepID=A0A1B7MT70_9AGAM|nr:hypothetical protein K503DRAFT_344264 [Rhizopogon vinicolor AM-OR11-026]